MFTLWQNYWDFHDTNKLYSIQCKVNNVKLIRYQFWCTRYVILKRDDEVIISRLRIGHSKLTHSYLLNKEFQPGCISCNCPLSIYHILLECCDYTPIRIRLFGNIQFMRDLFANIDYHGILQYVHECDIYRKIWSFNT
jgi:hypothetical protein